MNALDDVLAEFVAELGLGPAPIDGEAAVFRFEQRGRLFVERRGERILVYLEAPEPSRGAQTLGAALAACDLHQGGALAVRAGITADDRLVLGVAFGDGDFTLQALHAALDQLTRLQGDIALGTHRR